MLEYWPTTRPDLYMYQSITEHSYYLVYHVLCQTLLSATAVSFHIPLISLQVASAVSPIQTDFF